MQRCKGTARCLEKHSTQVTLCCAHGMCCKHRDKPWFSWHPAAAEHGQNEQKNKRMVKTGRQSMSQQKRMVNTNQPHSQNEIRPSQFVQLSVHQPPAGQCIRFYGHGESLVRGITVENGHYRWCVILSLTYAGRLIDNQDFIRCTYFTLRL